MVVHLIRLPRDEWRYDDERRLGTPGGFGEVFYGVGASGEVAVKRLRLSAGQTAHRELKIGDQLFARDVRSVVPILDAGQDAESDRYLLVMPVCERSLQDDLDRSPDGLSVEEAIEVARCIVAGLLEVKDITHRDLKPGNVLRHGGTWKIADFGIAKFVGVGHDAVKPVIEALARTERNFIVKKDEKTISIENPSEYNDLRGMVDKLLDKIPGKQA